jgi:hypothetical protein
LAKVTPRSPISARVRGIAAMSAAVWSSVSITTTFGAAPALPVATRLTRTSRTVSARRISGTA